MRPDEKNVLNGIVQHIENQMVNFDSPECTLIAKGLVRDGERGLYAQNYLQTPRRDLVQVRNAIALLPID